MGAFLSSIFCRNTATALLEEYSEADDLRVCGQDESEHGLDVQLFDCAFIAGVCQDQVAKRMLAFTRDQYPLEVIVPSRFSLLR